ncbi:hypothetical protein JB92DRAFT_3136745 [Gautieria morchelliformis]|nr:hypothetical protein JB92DRAFT_3136745 [Gautieria morchelliformis]
MAMTPANDAFTLNNRYSHNHTRRSPRPSTRSPSPTAVAMGIGKLTRRNPRRLSHSGSNGNLLHDIGEDAIHTLETRQYDEDTYPLKGQKVKKIDWEIPRKTFHSSIGFLVVPLYTSGFSARPVIIILSGALAIISAAEVLRFRNAAFARFYERILGPLMRNSEKHKVNGVVWYILGVLFSLIIYPLDVAVVSILILSWADTTASTFGRLWGPYTRPLPSHIPLIPFLPVVLSSRLGLPLARRKSLAGFIAASLTSGAIALSFWGWLAPIRDSEPIWTWDNHQFGGWSGLGLLSSVTALIGGVAEALDLGSLDDNLTLPIISGGVLWGFIRGLSFLF